MTRKIDPLIKAAQVSIEGLERLIVHFFECVSSEDWHNASNNSDEIKKCLEIWKDNPLSQYYLNAIDGTNAYFDSDGGKAEQNLIKVLPPNYHWENTDIQGTLESMIAGTYRSKGQFDKAIFHLSNAIKLIDPKGPLCKMLVMSYYQLGEIYRLLGEAELAEKYYQEGIDSEKYANANLFRLYSGLGNLYVQTGNLDKAKAAFEQSLNASESPAQEARAYFDLGQYYQKVGNFDTALKHSEASYKIRQEENLLDAAISCRILTGKILLKQNKLTESIETLKLAMSILSSYSAGTKRKEIFGLLSRAYEKSGDYKLAYESFLEFEKIQSNIFSTQQKEIFKLKNKEINQQKEKVELAHKDIQDSILYAKRIQNAILPPLKTVKEHLQESFVLYKPKDIVAGDFYWLEHRDGKTFFAAADCTGHGVPGAMVSVVCNNGLNRSVREFGLVDPGLILDQTRSIVIEEFAKSEEDVKDGMDIALCVLDGKKLSYAGAHNPLWIVRNGLVIETKANKQPVGKFDIQTPFITHSYNLEKGDSIYIFSDGYVDQFGGQKEKKFKTKAFRKLLISIQEKSMEEQQILIDHAFETWKGDLEQVDDVCVIGVRI